MIMFQNHVRSRTALSRQRNSAALEEITFATSGGQPNSGATSKLLSHDEGHKNLMKIWKCPAIFDTEFCTVDFLTADMHVHTCMWL